MIINDIFTPYSYHQITDEELYLSEGNIPVYTGNKDIKGFGESLFLDNIDNILPCIAFPLKGNNSGFSYVVNESFDANNTGLLVPKDEYRTDINLDWFRFKLRGILINIQTNKEGVSFINKDILKDIEIELPSIEKQTNELKFYEKLENLKNVYYKILMKCELLLNKNIVVNFNEDSTIELSYILKYISRNDSLSEEGLYNIEKKRSSANITVLSGSIDNIYYGEIPVDIEKIHFLDNRQGLHIVTRGKAGRLTYLPKGRYATNTNAFILYLSDDIKKDLKIETELDEETYLRFLKIYLEPIFLDVSSNSDVSVFPLTKVFKNLLIPKFELTNSIRLLVEKYNNINKISHFVKKEMNKIEHLLSKEII